MIVFVVTDLKKKEIAGFICVHTTCTTYAKVSALKISNVTKKKNRHSHNFALVASFVGISTTLSGFKIPFGSIAFLIWRIRSTAGCE